jgi:hypothetical protein
LRDEQKLATWQRRRQVTRSAATLRRSLQKCKNQQNVYSQCTPINMQIARFVGVATNMQTGNDILDPVLLSAHLAYCWFHNQLPREILILLKSERNEGVKLFKLSRRVAKSGDIKRYFFDNTCD